MNKLTTIAAIALIAATTTADAGWRRWSTEAKRDPFSKGQRVTASYMSSIRSGMFVSCDTSKAGIEIKAVAGWRLDTATMIMLAATDITAAVAVDGEVVVDGIKVSAGQFGNSIAGVSGQLDHGDSEMLLRAMMSARRQIAVKDGISDKSHLMRASGSTRAAQRLMACLQQQ